MWVRFRAGWFTVDRLCVLIVLLVGLLTWGYFACYDSVDYWFNSCLLFYFLYLWLLLLTLVTCWVFVDFRL